ncbi:MAG TPA: serine/threonine-protein kinase [Xanthomonadaceae bacterium]|nr:serine/threonine-protein kinase [Xanthomonadaceae bacterium]
MDLLEDRTAAETRQQARRLLASIETLPSGQRHGRLRELTSDPDTIALVEHWLDGAEAGAGPSAAADDTARAGDDGEDTELDIGDVLGAWKLVERIASGGMGTVFLAERIDRAYSRRVAIKLLRGTADATTVERMSLERQILARLQHGGIARLYDGGSTPAGHPYLVMEYVEGLPLDRYCAEQRPGLAARIRLFQRICEAVEAAHRHLVVHCDLKPANVVVRPDGEPVLLDFGVARAAGSARATAGGSYCTPAYASPELLSNRVVSTGSDIFSLGVLLTELLAGQRASRAPGAQLPLPSALAAPDLPWRARLRGDLDAIAARASAAEPARRYQTVTELREDLDRYLRRHPVRARPATPGYRLRRLLRRRWVEASFVGLVALLSTGFVWGLQRERDAARHAAATSEQVQQLLVDAFTVADPKIGKGSVDLSARDVLDAAAAKIDDGSIRDPGLLAPLQQALGKAYGNLGHPELAEPLLLASADAFQQPSVGAPGKAAEVYSELAVLRANSGMGASAVAAGRRSLALREQVHAGPLEVADSLNSLGIALVKMDAREAETVLNRALALRLRHAGTPSVPVASTLHNLGMLARKRGDFIAAERWYRQALAMKEALGGGENASYEHSLSGLAQSLAGQDRLVEAAQLQRRVLALSRHLYGDGTGVATAHNELASTLHDLGAWPEAAAHYKEAARLSAASAGADSVDYAVQLNNLASLDEDRGAIAEAERGFRRSLAIRTAKLGESDPSVLRARLNLGRLLLRSGRAAEAGGLIAPAWTTWRATQGDGPASRGHRLLFAEWLLATGQRGQAADELRALAAQPLGRPRRAAWLASLQADLAARAGDRRGVVDARRRAVDILAAAFGAAHVETARRRVEYAQGLADAGDDAGARMQLQLAVPVLAPRLADGAPLWTAIHGLQARLGKAPDAR